MYTIESTDIHHDEFMLMKLCFGQKLQQLQPLQLHQRQQHVWVSAVTAQYFGRALDLGAESSARSRQSSTSACK